MNQNIAVLSPQVSAKIAAGEVIERPSAVVRELLDNAIDAGATQISLYLEDGGLQLIRVNDDGFGMSREDLELCYLAHATSKIRQTNDLLQLCSLGFRGEALGSIAACSKLRIISAQEQQNGELKTYELRVDDSILQGMEPSSAAHSGTQIEVRELFYSFPARRKFLNSSRSELSSCKAVFREKTLAFPHIHFQFYNNSKMELSLAPGSVLERLCQVYTDLVAEQLLPLQQETEHFSLQLFASLPTLYRRDRKRMPIYINQRPIAENSLQQAVRLGYNGYLAGGLFPICFSFLEVVPDRVDFNIHPAKREARLRDLSLIQASIRQTLRSFCRESGKRSSAAPSTTQEKRLAHTGTQVDGQNKIAETAQEIQFAEESLGQKLDSMNKSEMMAADSGSSKIRYPKFTGGKYLRTASHSYHPNSSSKRNGSIEQTVGQNFSARELQRSTQSTPDTLAEQSSTGQTEANRAQWHPTQVDFHKKQPFHYFGQLFEVFLLVEKPPTQPDSPAQLLIVDQHASHERILYETLESEMLQKQALLLPIAFEVEAAEVVSLRQRSPALEAIGIEISEGGKDHIWHIHSLPPSVSDFKEELIELVRHGASEAEDLKCELFAHLSCRKAIKKGDILDDISAIQLLETVFSMGLERCPHGRPLWYSLDQPELYRLLQRT